MTTGGGTGSAVAPAHTPEWAALVRAIEKAQDWTKGLPAHPDQLMGELFYPLLRYSRTMGRVGNGADQSAVDSQLADTVRRIIDHIDLTQDVMAIMAYITTRLRGGLGDAIRAQARQATGMGRNVAAHRRQFLARLERAEAEHGVLTERQKDEIVQSVFATSTRTPPLMATVDAVRYGAAPETLMPDRYGLGDGTAPGPEDEGEEDDPALANALHMTLLDLSRQGVVFRALRGVLCGERPRDADTVAQGAQLLMKELRRLFPEVEVSGLPSTAPSPAADPV